MRQKKTTTSKLPTREQKQSLAGKWGHQIDAANAKDTGLEVRQTATMPFTRLTDGISFIRRIE